VYQIAYIFRTNDNGFYFHLFLQKKTKFNNCKDISDRI